MKERRDLERVGRDREIEGKGEGEVWSLHKYFFFLHYLVIWAEDRAKNPKFLLISYTYYTPKRV